MPALTGIRGVAATGVLFAHINADLEDWSLMEKYLYAQAYVDLFFILSGFVISYVYMTKSEWAYAYVKKFYIARFARIYPLQLFSLTIALLILLSNVLTVENLPNAISHQALIKQVLLLNAMPVVTLNNTLIFTSWSVSIEWWLYILVFPILFTLKNIRKYLASPLIITLTMLSVVVFLHNLPDDVRFTRGWPAWIRGVSGFSVGWLIHYHYTKRTKFSVFCQKYCTLLVSGWMLTILILPQFTLQQPWVALVLSPFVLMGLCYDTSTASKLLSNKAIVFLGDISYSIYMLHPIVLIILTNIFPFLDLSDALVIILFTSLGVGLTLITSSISYNYIEKPGRNWLNRKLYKR
ncbi:acyltransferase family protein [Mucilaginibacter hurinus]|uniref:acyltransferase family protein n=1 Tax=Mucilaginibacter hurinus TaxID=2201324 RepID=UPI001314E8BA|nr:acyltransferase [Mucilaginibacter hurinus]